MNKIILTEGWLSLLSVFKPHLTQTNQTIRIINLIYIFVFVLWIGSTANTKAQVIKISTKSATFRSVIQQVQKQSGFSFAINEKHLNSAKPVTLTISKDLKEALPLIFQGQPFGYKLEGKIIISVDKPTNNNVVVRLSDNQQQIRGKVSDADGNPIKGASIRLKSDAKSAVVSDEMGQFILPITVLNEIIIVSFIGYENREVKASLDRNKMTIILKNQEESVEEVIVTGIITRKKQSFTGAAAAFTGEELKMVNNQNVIASLRALDPSFIQIENNSIGSNPNMLPTIELRGQTSIASNNLRDEFSTDPNQPLFVLDGFETNLRTIMDLDMNIIQSVTILKDAASTAIYGSRASNGVVVVETIKPKVGKINLSYATDLQTQIADLSSYNMMNAAEKLEFERLSGRYEASNGIIPRQMQLDSLYNHNLSNVLRGVDTYWLNKAVQNGFSHRHSLSARGGEGAVVFDIGVNYKNTQGTMIGSGRDDWGSNLNLIYRNGKLNISNRAFASGYKSKESPYGSFSTWVNTNPYYEYKSADEKYLTPKLFGKKEGVLWPIANPLYNANLASFDIEQKYTINNNLMLSYDLSKEFRITAGAQISKALSDDNVFVSPLHSSFDEVENIKKGSLRHRVNSAFSYTGNLMVTYAKVFNKVHSLTTNLRGEISENNSNLNGYTAVGFPAASNGNPTFAFGFEQDSQPSASSRTTRRTTILASMNYSYAQKYNVDLNYNIDGSTSFGSNNLFSPYYSAGLSWNIHNESFLASQTWVNSLRIRGNIGVTGNQNFGNVSQSIFNYNPDINRFGQGISLFALGAPDLAWQRTTHTSLGIDAKLFNNRLNVEFNAYDKVTDPLVVAITLPSSTGLSSYPFNAGSKDYKGVEAIINYSPIYRPADRVVLTFGMTGSAMKGKYAKFGNKLKALNTEMLESNSLVRFLDGYGPDDLWAVRSLGIDPTTGREVFLTKTGEQTFNYNSDDIVKVGNGQALAEGVLRGTFSYKGFTTNVLIRYILQKDRFNHALFEKVENMSEEEIVSHNQDKRALYDRWKNVGDISQFKGIAITTTTPISSRFIQREHSFSGESINFGYEFRDAKWLDRVYLSNLRVNAYMNDIFYQSTVKRERGINYPFARSVSFSLNATLK